MLLPVGTIFEGKYEIRSTIGSGGMGIVYEAYQSDLARLVAIKILTAASSSDEDECLRFAREAKILSRLSHPHIVRFYAYGIWATYPYIVMEHLSGNSLQELLCGQSLKSLNSNTNALLDIALQICSALKHAHGEGIYHRDIKPSNVIVEPASSRTCDQIKLVDFGLAKLTGIDGQQKLTRTGMALGSVQYMSPEQCLGQPVDARTDIYGFGCLLYECYTGEPLVQAENGVAAMFSHLNQPATQARKWRDLPPSIQHVLEKCLAKRPEHRYDSVSELETDLQYLKIGAFPVSNRVTPAETTTIVSSAVPSGSSYWRNAVLIFASLLAGLLLAFFVLNHGGTVPGETPPDSHAVAQNPDMYMSAKSAFAAGDLMRNRGLDLEAIALLRRANQLLENEDGANANVNANTNSNANANAGVSASANANTSATLSATANTEGSANTNSSEAKTSPGATTKSHAAVAAKVDRVTRYLIKQRLSQLLSMTDDLEEASGFSLEAIDASSELPKNLRAQAYSSAADVAYRAGRPEQSLAYAKIATDLWRQALNESTLTAKYKTQLFKDLSKGLGQVAISLERMGRLKDAERYRLSAVAELRDNPQSVGEKLAALRSLADNYVMQHNYSQALHTLDRWLRTEAQVADSNDKFVIEERVRGHELRALVLIEMGERAKGDEEFSQTTALIDTGDPQQDNSLLISTHCLRAIRFYRRGMLKEGDVARTSAQQYAEKSTGQSARSARFQVLSANKERELALKSLGSTQTSR